MSQRQVGEVEGPNPPPTLNIYPYTEGLIIIKAGMVATVSYQILLNPILFGSTALLQTRYICPGFLNLGHK